MGLEGLENLEVQRIIGIFEILWILETSRMTPYIHDQKLKLLLFRYNHLISCCYPHNSSSLLKRTVKNFRPSRVIRYLLSSTDLPKLDGDFLTNQVLEREGT